MVGALNSFKPTAVAPQSAPSGKSEAAVAQDPVDSLPDLSTIEARAQEFGAGAESPEMSTGLSKTQKAILTAAGVATAGVALFTPASAQAGPRHGRRYDHNPHYNHRQRDRDRDKAGAIIGGIIGGIILGEIIRDGAPPPVYYPPQYPQQVQRPFYDNYGRLICPNGQGGWYASVDRYQCRAW